MKITQKQLNGYVKSFKAGLNGIGFNDYWNMQNFGITKNLSNKIDKAITEEYGLIFPTKPSLTAINKRLESIKEEAMVK